MEQKRGMTRRDFLNRVGKVGGAIAVFGAMESLGLLSTSASANSFQPPAQGDLALTGRTGKKIVILGAGLAGMAAAYELGKAGYDCHILEARQRSGGRNWTVRRGTQEQEINGELQKATYDPGHYFNAGPARIPQHHVTMDYCKELGVPLEVFSNGNEHAFYYQENVGALANQKYRKYEIKADARGYVAELLAKAVNQSALDQPLSSEDADRLLEYLRREGGLSSDFTYQGSSARGYSEFPGAGDKPGTLGQLHSFTDLLQSGMMNNFSSEYSFNQQMMMFQPIGGMDQIPKAFERKLAGKITFGAVVREIRQTGNGVRIIYSASGGGTQAIEGDYCICTIPLPVLKKIPADFSAEVKNAMNQIGYATTGKIGLQFKSRFWETEDRVYGGVTTTNMDINQIWYPSSDFLAQNGILVGYYNFGNNAVTMGNMSLAERQAHALAQGAKIHPQYSTEFETGFSLAWHKIRYSKGGWASYSESDLRNYYPILNRPQGRVYFAGEHLSYYTGWMAGAFESARKAVTEIHESVMKEPVTA